MSACQAGISLFRGNSGINSAIQQGDITLFQRTEYHTESVRAAVLFNLPFDRYEGIAALHVPNNMGYKSVLERELNAALGRRFTIRMVPIVPLAAFELAVRRGHVKKLTLFRRAGASVDPFLRAAGLGGDELRRMALTFEAKRFQFLRHDALERFIRSRRDEDKRDLLEFGSLPFEEASVEVQLPNGTTRTFQLENHEGGHPMSIELNIQESMDPSDSDTMPNFGAPAEQLSSALQDAISTVQLDSTDENAIH
ncbi:MAG: hypothetical protein F4071_01240 [Acidimicrobiaceae bacterium]|nr:hypothetical protein [Acidimicrobiaceae bacterium]